MINIMHGIDGPATLKSCLRALRAETMDIDALDPTKFRTNAAIIRGLSTRLAEVYRREHQTENQDHMPTLCTARRAMSGRCAVNTIALCRTIAGDLRHQAQARVLKCLPIGAIR